MQAQRPGRLDAVEIDHLGAVEQGQVAGLADLVDQRLEDGVARPMPCAAPVTSATLSCTRPIVLPLVVVPAPILCPQKKRRA